MFANFEFPAFSADSRANRIKEHARAIAPGGPGQPPVEYLYVCGPEEAVQQLELVSAGRGDRCAVPEEYRARYSHLLAFPGGMPPEVVDLADLLTAEVLTLTANPHLDCAIVLDWYKEPDPDQLGALRNTAVGELIYVGKYYKHSSPDRTRARGELVQRMAGIVRRHPLYAAASAIVSCPGHLADGSSFGEGLAASVASEVGTPIVATTCLSGPRLSLKEQPDQDLTEAFAMPCPLTGTVIVLDDVFHTGTTAGAVALAARRAGASRVLGLAAVRNLRR